MLDETSTVVEPTMVDRVVSDIRPANCGENLRPYGGMEALVFRKMAWQDFDDGCVTGHEVYEEMLAGIPLEQVCKIKRRSPLTISLHRAR